MIIILDEIIMNIENTQYGSLHDYNSLLFFNDDDFIHHKV